jgi:hypothetical protein
MHGCINSVFGSCGYLLLDDRWEMQNSRNRRASSSSCWRETHKIIECQSHFPCLHNNRLHTSTIIIKNRQEAANTPSAASCRGIPEIYFQIQELYWVFLDFLAFKHKSNLQTRFFPSSLSNSCLKLPQQQ